MVIRPSEVVFAAMMKQVGVLGSYDGGDTGGGFNYSQEFRCS